MLDDIIEIAIDILGEVAEIFISSKRHKKREKTKKSQKRKEQDPWERTGKAAPWEK